MFDEIEIDEILYLITWYAISIHCKKKKKNALMMLFKLAL